VWFCLACSLAPSLNRSSRSDDDAAGGQEARAQAKAARETTGDRGQ
jgi:hypothetical protein